MFFLSGRVIVEERAYFIIHTADGDRFLRFGEIFQSGSDQTAAEASVGGFLSEHRAAKPRAALDSLQSRSKVVGAAQTVYRSSWKHQQKLR